MTKTALHHRLHRMTCRTRQELDSRYNAEKSTMIQFSERIIYTLAELSAFWAKYLSSHTCSMSEMTCRTLQERSVFSWYKARLSTMIEFSERIIHKRAEPTALWAKHHCISYLLDVKMGCQTRRDKPVDFWYNARKMILRNLARFTALSAIHHSTAHTHTPSQFHRTLIGCSPFEKVNNCQSFYSQFEFWNLAKIILFGCFWLTLLLWLCRHN